MTIGDNANKLVQFIQGLSDFSIVTEIDGNYHTPALSSKEAIARIREGEGWFLKLNQAVSPEDTKKILQTVFDKELDGEKRKNLDYLDLRVKGKVYYKLR